MAWSASVMRAVPKLLAPKQEDEVLKLSSTVLIS